MKSKLLLILAIFCFFSIGVGVYNAKNNMAEWDQFEKEFKQKTFEMSQKTNFLRLSSGQEKSEKEDKDEEGQTETKSVAKTEDQKDSEEPAYQPTDQDPLKHISKELQETQSFKDLIDFRNDELDLVLDSKDKAELSRVSAQVIEQISACLQSKACLEKKSLNDPNYGFENTRSYQLLERALHTAIILSEENPRMAENFNQKTAQAVLDVEGPDIQSLGVELLTVSEKLSDDNFNYLLKKAPSLHKESRAVLFSQTERFTRNDEQKRSRYLGELKNELNRDAESAVEILKYLQFVKLSKQEIVKVSRGLCQYNSPTKAQKWKAIEYHHSLYQSAKGNDVSLKAICQN